MKESTLAGIERAVQHARKKHQDFAVNIHHAISLATEEMGELAKAVNDMSPLQVEAEAYDLIAVCVRIIEGDHLRRRNNE